MMKRVKWFKNENQASFSKKKLCFLVGGCLLLGLGWNGLRRTELYREIEYNIDQAIEQKQRDEEWGHLEYTGDEVMEQIKSEMSVIPYNEESFDPNATLEDLQKDGDKLFTSYVGNGIVMNQLGMFGDVSFLKITLYSFENTSIGGVDLAMNVYDTTPGVVKVAEEMFKTILPTGHEELIEHLNNIDYRGGEHQWDNRKVTVEFHNEGITFLFYGKE